MSERSDEFQRRKQDLRSIGNLEDWLQKQPDSLFPRFSKENGEISYPERYARLKQALAPLHHAVEKGALLHSVETWKEEISKTILLLEATGENTEELVTAKHKLESDPIVYLNQHGTGHVGKVIEKSYDIISNFNSDLLSPSEIFLLLCAIQVHDIGNVLGREDHEINMRRASLETLRPIIHDTVTQNLIYRIARVHSGNISGSKDTIGKSSLRIDGTFFDKTIREPLLAAILRFADELADDSSRSDKGGLQAGIIPDGSKIYHFYSESLHAVNIRENTISQTLYLALEYYIDFDLVPKKFLKQNSETLLIDEIFARTRKVELERRYCMRYFGQYIPLTEIRVRIEIDPEYDFMDPEIISYTLKENGYPSSDISIDCEKNSGELVIGDLKKKGWRL